MLTAPPLQPPLSAVLKRRRGCGAGRALQCPGRLQPSLAEQGRALADPSSRFREGWRWFPFSSDLPRASLLLRPPAPRKRAWDGGEAEPGCLHWLQPVIRLAANCTPLPAFLHPGSSSEAGDKKPSRSLVKYILFFISFSSTPLPPPAQPNPAVVSHPYLG